MSWPTKTFSSAITEEDRRSSDRPVITDSEEVVVDPTTRRKRSRRCWRRISRFKVLRCTRPQLARR
eukprot:4552597-Prorocentrum_lima.AAC.1